MNWIKQNWIKIGVGMSILIVASIAWYFFMQETKDEEASLCPYASLEDFTKEGGDFESFTSFYFNERFNPSDDEVDLATKNMLISKGCDKVASGLDEKFRKRDERSPKTYSSKIGFSFQYPSNLFVQTYNGEMNWITVYPKSKIENNEESTTAIVISWSDDNPDMTAEEWLNGPNAGYDASRDGNYRNLQIDGQDAVMTEGDWIVVKTPDNKTRLSFAYLVKEELGAQPLKEELANILKSFKFE